MQEREELEGQLAEAGRELHASETAREQALAKIATLARQAHGVVPIAQIAELTNVSRPTVYKMLSDPDT